MSARNLFLAFILFAEGRNMSNSSTYQEKLRMKKQIIVSGEIRGWSALKFGKH